MEVLKVVDLKDALNHKGKAVVITPQLKEMYDIRAFGQDFSFLCKAENQPAEMLSMKEAFNYKGNGVVRAITPDMTETMSLDDFKEGFFFLILTDEDEPTEKETTVTRRSSRRLAEERAKITEEGEDEIDVTFDD